MSGLTTSTAASACLSAADARQQARIDHTDEDALLSAYVLAAMAEAEQITGRALWRTTYVLTLDQFPAGDDPILFPRPPLVSVTSLAYTDTNGDAQTINPATLQLDASSEPGRLVPAVNDVWPDTQTGAVNAVRITYTAGPATPDPLGVQAVRLAVAGWFENREDVVMGSVSKLPNGFERLLMTRRFRCHLLRAFLANH